MAAPLIPKLRLRYGVYDHDTPAVFTQIEAYMFNGYGRWAPLNMADVMMKTGVISRAEFEERFPNLPPLPPNAFTATK